MSGAGHGGDDSATLKRELHVIGERDAVVVDAPDHERRRGRLERLRSMGPKRRQMAQENRLPTRLEVTGGERDHLFVLTRGDRRLRHLRQQVRRVGRDPLQQRVAYLDAEAGGDQHERVDSDRSRQLEPDHRPQ